MSLISDIIGRIADQMGNAIRTIDEDYGQVETQSDTYPVVYPAVLVNIDNIEWQSLRNLDQRGRLTLRVTLYLNCYDDTHYGQSQLDAADTRETLLHNLYCALQGYQPDTYGSCLNRTTTQYVSLEGGIKAYTMTFAASLNETNQPTDTDDEQPAEPANNDTPADEPVGDETSQSETN